MALVMIAATQSNPPLATVAAREANRSYLHNGTCLYELTSGHARRYHIVCKQCGRTDPVEFDLAGDTEEKLRQKGYAEISHVIEFFGVCPTCLQKAAPQRESSVAVQPAS